MYRLAAAYPATGDGRTYNQAAAPAWLEHGAEASGRFLAEAGLPMPVLNPEHAVLLHLAAA